VPNAQTVDAKGDLLVATADNTLAKRRWAATRMVLTADSTQTTGVKWATASSGANIDGAGTGAVAAAHSSDTGHGVVHAGHRHREVRFGEHRG